jgi:hypothetical protein
LTGCALANTLLFAMEWNEIAPACDALFTDDPDDAATAGMNVMSWGMPEDFLPPAADLEWSAAMAAVFFENDAPALENKAEEKAADLPTPPEAVLPSSLPSAVEKTDKDAPKPVPPLASRAFAEKVRESILGQYEARNRRPPKILPYRVLQAARRRAEEVDPETGLYTPARRLRTLQRYRARRRWIEFSAALTAWFAQWRAIHEAKEPKLQTLLTNFGRDPEPYRYGKGNIYSPRWRAWRLRVIERMCPRVLELALKEVNISHEEYQSQFLKR